MYKLKILIADDQEHVRLGNEQRIERNTRNVFRPDITLAETAEAAVDLIAQAHETQAPFDIAFVDIDFKSSPTSQGLDGHEASKKIKALSPHTIVVIVSALEEEEHLNLAGENDAVTRFFRRKHFTNDELYWVCLEALVSRLHRENALLPADRIIYTRSPRMRRFLESLDRVRPDANTLISGGTGSGKELAARRLNANAQLANGQKSRPFIAVNCANFDGSMTESRLFGYKRGAFTGAVADTPGIFDAAQDGDIFFDELQSAPIQLQQVLMRALQEKVYSPLMSNRIVPLKARFIAAINKPLSECVAKGLLKNDLVARLQQDYLHIPALRERPEDIPHILEVLLKRKGSADKSFSLDAIDFLSTLKWPENVRGLEKVAVAALAHCKLPIITAGYLKGLRSLIEAEAQLEDTAIFATDSDNKDGPTELEIIADKLIACGQPVSDTLEAVQEFVVKRSWEKHKNVTGVAKDSGLPFTTAKRRLIELGMILDKKKIAANLD